jgi:sugar-specific transcriptional regulator TrmB
MNLQEALENWGLDTKEIKVYLACLELGKAKVQDIAKKTGIERTNNYSLLEGLMKKGLVREIETAKKRTFIAESPDHLILKLKERENLISQVMPELKSLYNLAPNKPKVRFYEGKDGYYAISEESLQGSERENLYLGNLANLYESLGDGLKYDEEYYIPKRMKKKIHLRMLVFSDQRTQEMRRKDKKENRETRFLPDNFSFEGSLWLFEDKAALISSSKELIGLVMESEYIVQMLRNLFEIAWQAAK